MALMSLLRRYDALLDAVLAELRRAYGDRLVGPAYSSEEYGPVHDDETSRAR